MRILFALGVYPGLRLKDCASLRWSEVDLPRELIRRVPSKTARRNPKPVIVPIHPSLRAILAEVAQGELDHRGKPAVVCRNGDREFFFCRGPRSGKDVWVCWERRRRLTSRILQPPDRTDAAQAASAAQSGLARLEPGFGVYLDLASEPEGTKS